jgi:hypothetical protein
MLKILLVRACSGLLIVALMALPIPSLATVVLDYAASAGPGAALDANAGTVNLWSVNSTGDAGSFLGNSASNANGSAAGAGNPAWALYANPGANVAATADIASLVGRSLSLTGDSVALDFDNGWIANGGKVGIRFLNSDGAAVSEMSFTGGQSSYRVTDGSGSGFDSGKGFTGDGFRLTLSLTSNAGAYDLALGSTLLSGRLLSTSTQDIASVVVFNQAAGFPGQGQYDAYFNNVSISAVPEFGMATAAPFIVGAFFSRRRKPTQD